jgi:COMPASS component SWD2
MSHVFTDVETEQTKLKPAKVFKGSVEPGPLPSSSSLGALRGPVQGPRHITGLSFDDRGEFVLTAAEDETFRLYSCKSGKYVRPPSFL